MAPRVRDRRIENEWALFCSAQHRNPALLEILGKQAGPDGESFSFILLATPGLVEIEGQKVLFSSHRAELRFPRFFPYVPTEVRLVRPVFHPNVDPSNGFVCLWSRFAVEDTVVTALQRLQKVVAWELINQNPRHIIHQAAIDWYNNPLREFSLPLPYTPIITSDPLPAEHAPTPLQRRSRLS